MKNRTDIQNLKPNERFKINRVGVVGVKKPIHITRMGKEHVLSAHIDVSVDLPPTQKGSHMSRNIEVVNEILDLSVRKPSDSLESVAAAIVDRLLERHDYAKKAEARISADYYMERFTPNNLRTYENYMLIAYAKADRSGHRRKAVGVEVTGMTACPCAMEEVRAIYMEKYGSGFGVSGAPGITHNQRNITTLIIETPMDADIEAEDLICLVEDALSTPTYEILKREDEAKVVLRAHENPKFVEDVVRGVLKSVVERYPTLSDDAVVWVRSESQESIHKHNAYGERKATMGELRR